ncbi:MAG: helix-turn-helix domain-containing protein [Oscillospiraceae bacterium]|nr:helix-turn-helix domain-containing protein [Oscillospiraceae bacterium]
MYSFLVSSAGQKGKCWPSMRTIAASCRCSETAAREAIAALEQKGFIRRVKRYQDRPNGSVRQTSNAYYIQEQPPLPASWGRTPAGGGGVIYEQDEEGQLKPSTAGQVWA